MTEQAQENKPFNSFNLIEFFWRHKWKLIILSLTAGIAAAIFSGPFFITPMYKSTVVLFPSSTNSISKALLADNFGLKQDILQFGEEEEAEQLLQILNSSKIRDRIVQKYDLMKHYEIDSTEKYFRTKLFKEYAGNIKFRRTEYMAVEITVMDRHPDTAALIANDISDLLDSTKIFMQKIRATKGFRIVNDEYQQLRDWIKDMEDSLAVLRTYGVHDYESQAEMINRQLAIEIAKNPNSKAVKALEEKLDVLAKYGTPYVSIRDQLEYEKKQLSLIKSKFEEAKVDAEEELPQTFVVDRAYPAEKKTYPVRSIIVLVSMVSVFLLTVLTLLLLENFKTITFSKK
jgi:uncharacterized protein involved in exopolysaccharide biosynthesis